MSTLAFVSLLAIPQSGFEAGVAAVISAVPSLLDGLWRLLVGLAAWWAGILVVAVLIGRRWGVLRDLILALALAAIVSLVVGRLVHGAYELIWDLPLDDGVTPWIPWLRITLPVTGIATISPFLTKTFRSVGLWVVLSAVTGAVILSSAPSLVLASAATAFIAAATTHLLFGSSMGWPEIEAVATGLDALGVDAHSLRVVDRQGAGVFRLEATSPDGRRLDIKVYGRDAADTQFVSTLWRRLFYRGLEDHFTTGRLHQVEHEAYVTMLASQHGLAGQDVVMGGLSPNGDAILVLQDRADFSRSTDWDENRARSVWSALDSLHGGGVAHGQVESENLVSSRSGVGFVDYRAAVAGPQPWRLTADRIQVLVMTALILGPERAIAVAHEALGSEALADMLPMLQADLVTGEARRALRAKTLDIDDLRERTARHLEIEPPELERLRRVTVGSILKTALPILAFFALASIVAGLDIGALGNALADAAWWFVGVGFLVAQIPRLGQAISAMGASPVPLPLGRVYILQLAQGFIALTIPSAAARIAMNVRFLQRHGLPGGTALAAGALDGFAGFMSQVILFIGVVTFSSLTVDLDLDTDLSSGLVTLLLIVVGVVVATVLTVLAVPRLRQPVITRIRQYGGEARAALRGLGSPRRLLFLLGGNLGTEFLSAVALGVFVLALGYPVSIPELILISVVVSLFAGIMPVPGGIGVFEGGLILGLSRAGVPEEAAFAAAILFRASTYYLPPIWGFFAFRWLEDNKYL